MVWDVCCLVSSEMILYNLEELTRGAQLMAVFLPKMISQEIETALGIVEL